MSFHAEQIASYNHESISFGIDQKKTAEQLRKLADEIEKGCRIKDVGAEYILLQNCETTYAVESDDYALTTIKLVFATKKFAPPFGISR